MILAHHFSFDKSQIAVHDSLFKGMEQHVQNSLRCRPWALRDCFGGHGVDLDWSTRFWEASWDLQSWCNMDFQIEAGRRSPLSGTSRALSQQTWSILIGSHDYVWSQSERQSHKSKHLQGLIWCFQLSALIQLACFYPFIASRAALVVYKPKNQNKNGKKTTTANSKSKSILVYQLFNQCFLTDQRAWLFDSR